MNIQALLNLLRELDVKLSVKDGQLHYSAPKGVLTPQLRAELANQRAELIHTLHEVNWAERDNAPLRQEESLPHETHEPAGSALVLIQRGAIRERPVFFMHPIGGTVFCYDDLARHLRPQHPFYGLQARGLEGEQQPPTHIEEMATDYIRSIRTVQARGPYLLGGWSMGGVVAFEMAQQLSSQGEQVELLALVDSFAPVGEPASAPSDPLSLQKFVWSMGLQFNRDSFEQACLQCSTFDQQVVYVINEALRDQKLLSAMDPVQIGRLFRVFRSDALALSQYSPRVYAGPVNVMRASEQANRGFTEDLGWKTFASSDITVDVIPGNHFTILQEPNVRHLARTLSARCHPRTKHFQT